jgi:hypothetical protein
MSNIQIQIANFEKSFHVYVQMYWLLVKKEYIIVFVYIISAVVHDTVCVTYAKWFAEESPESWAVGS